MSPRGRARRSAAGLATAAVLLLSGVEAARAQRAIRDLERLFESLEANDEAVRRNALSALLAMGPEAAAAALEGFAEAPARSRRLRAALVRRVGEASSVEAVLRLLDDPDPAVREEWVGFLGRRELGSAAARACARGLGLLAEGKDPQVRFAAARALVERDDLPSAEAAASLLRLPDPALRRLAAQVLSNQSSARPFLADVVLSMTHGEVSIARPLLLSLGESLAFAEARGVERSRDAVAIYARLWNATDPELAGLARAGFRRYVRHLSRRGMGEVAAAVLEELSRLLPEPSSVLLDLSRHHLIEGADFEAAERAAARAEATLGMGGNPTARFERAFALGLRGVAALARARGEEAEDLLARSEDIADRLSRSRSERPELLVGDPAALLALRIRCLRALNALANGGDDDEARGRASSWIKEAYQEALNLRPDFDAVLGGSGPEAAGELGAEAVATEVLARIGRADDAARALDHIGRTLASANPLEFLPVYGGETQPEDLEENPRLARPVSAFPIRLAGFRARATGDAEGAAALLERTVKRLAFRTGDPDAVWLLAHAEVERGGVYLQLRRGDEAAEAIRKGIELGESLRRAAEARGDGMDVERMRRFLSSAYVSLAVNENVVRGNPRGARAFCAKAVDLHRSDFNRILLACYLAREGDGPGAREILDEVPPAPDLYYNIACTHALLGEKEPALEMLRLHLEDGVEGGVFVERLREWARNDPDLRSLRDDPRFREMTGLPPGP